MLVHTYSCTYTHMQTGAHIYTYMYVHTYSGTHMYTYTQVYTIYTVHPCVAYTCTHTHAATRNMI